MNKLHLRMLIAGSVFLTVACVSQSRTARVQPAQPVQPPTAMDRQIRNAIDAGDGDYRIRELRRRVAEEPENVAVRLELARAYGEGGYPDLELEHCRLASARFP